MEIKDINSIEVKRPNGQDDNVYILPGCDVPVERTLTRAMNAELSTVLVIGYDARGEEYFVTNTGDAMTLNWLLDRCKQQLVEFEVKDEVETDGQ